MMPTRAAAAIASIVVELIEAAGVTLPVKVFNPVPAVEGLTVKSDTTLPAMSYVMPVC
jgi:hypothetical protein